MGTTDDFFSSGGCQTLPAAFPKGYAAFYCMKYEISQGQYAEFLSKLTDDQDHNRYYVGSTWRYTISEELFVAGGDGDGHDSEDEFSLVEVIGRGTVFLIAQLKRAFEW